MGYFLGYRINRVYPNALQPANMSASASAAAMAGKAVEQPWQKQQQLISCQEFIWEIAQAGSGMVYSKAVLASRPDVVGNTWHWMCRSDTMDDTGTEHGDQTSRVVLVIGHG